VGVVKSAVAFYVARDAVSTSHLHMFWLLCDKGFVARIWMRDRGGDNIVNQRRV